MPCHSHTFLVTAPDAGMFCLSGMQLMWPTKTRFVRAHWLAHLQLLLAGDCSEGGSQERWLLLHVLINLEVTVQRGCFWLHSAVEFSKLSAINVFFGQLLQDIRHLHSMSTIVPAIDGSYQVMLARDEQRATFQNISIKHVVLTQTWYLVHGIGFKPILDKQIFSPNFGWLLMLSCCIHICSSSRVKVKIFVTETTKCLYEGQHRINPEKYRSKFTVSLASVFKTC